MTRPTTAPRHHASTWPPRDWPGCPGTSRYRSAIKHFNSNSDTFTPNPRISAQDLTARRSFTDAMLLDSILASTNSYTTCLTNAIDKGYEVTLPYAISLAEQVSDESLIPCVIITSPEEHPFPTTFAIFLSRHPRWMGISPNLPFLRDSHAIVYTYDATIPRAIIALTTELFDKDLHHLLHSAQPHPILETRQGRTIDRILRHHGATPHYTTDDPATHLSSTFTPAGVHPDSLNQDPPRPTTPPLITGEPWERRN